MDVSFAPLGDRGVRMQFLHEVTPALNGIIRAFARRLEAEQMTGVVEWVPTYEALTVYYQPDLIDYQDICARLASMAQEDLKAEDAPSQTVVVPVLYGGEAGVDLEDVARAHDLTAQEVIDRHAGEDYLVYMMGFLPGFPYLGGMPASIATSRRSQPRSQVPAGSVGIAGSQTGVYPLASPGGWNLIGRTPMPLFDPERKQPFLYQAGDYIRFTSIREGDYARIREEVKQGRYEVEKAGGR